LSKGFKSYLTVLKKIIVFIYSCFICLQLQAQSAQLYDSLKANIDGNPGQDSNRVKAIYQYLRAGLYNTAEQQPYIQEMLHISRKINFPYGIRKGLSQYVKYHGDRSDFQQSFSYADSLTNFLKNDTSTAAKREMAFLWWDLGNNYNRIGDYNKALEYYFLAAEYFDKASNKNLTASLYGNISSIYTQTSDTLRSMEYMQKALAIAESADDDLKCTVFMNHANNLLNQGKYSEARKILDRIKPIIKKVQVISYSQYYFYISGFLAQRQNDYEKAISEYRESLRFARKNNSVHQITGVMSQMFECFNATNNLAESKIYLDSTLLLSVQSGLKTRRKQVYDGFATWYEKRGDHSRANAYLKKSIALNDSLLSEENNKEIASLEMRYQVAGKESEIRSLKAEKDLHELTIRQQNALNYVLIASALTYRTYKQKQRLQQQRISELETEKQLSATEAVLKGEEQERTRLAKDLHDGLGGMLSGIKYGLQNMK
jgi:two-component system NarL family sensor kinase